MDKIIVNPLSVRATGNIKNSIIINDLTEGNAYVEESTVLINNNEERIFILSDPLMFEDACDSDAKLTNYGSPVSLSGNTNTSYLEFDSNNDCYYVHANGNYGIIPITSLNGLDNFKITGEFKTLSNTSAFQGGFGFKAQNSTNSLLIRKHLSYCYATLNLSNDNLVGRVRDSYNYWHRFEITRQGRQIGIKVTDIDNNTSISHDLELTFEPYHCGFIVAGGENCGSYVRNVKIEKLWQYHPPEPVYVYVDDGSIDNTSLYDVRGKMGGSNTNIDLSYDENEGAYLLSGSGGEYFGWFAIPDIKGQDNIRITVKVKLIGTSAYNQCYIGLTDTQAQAYMTDFIADLFRIRADNKADFIHNNGNNEVSGSSFTVSVRNAYVYLVFERSGSDIVGRVYDAEKNLIHKYTYTTSNSYSDPYYIIGVNCRNSTDTKYIKEITVEEL